MYIFDGVPSPGDTSLKDKDSNLVKSFLESIEANVEPKAIIRFGTENAEKISPEDKSRHEECRG